MFSSYFQGASVFVPDKYTCEVRINVIIVASKKLKFYDFMVSLYSVQMSGKRGRKIIHHEPVHVE